MFIGYKSSCVLGRYTFERSVPLSPFATAGKIVSLVSQGCSIFQEITFLTAVLRYVGAFKENNVIKKAERSDETEKQLALDSGFHRFNSSHPISSVIVLTKSKLQII